MDHMSVEEQQRHNQFLDEAAAMDWSAESQADERRPIRVLIDRVVDDIEYIHDSAIHGVGQGIEFAREVSPRLDGVLTVVEGTRGFEVAQTAANEYMESDKKLATAATAAGALVMQFFDRSRTSLVIVPHIATEVLDRTQSPVQAGLAGGGAYALWCGIVGGALTEALARFPRALETFKEKFPKVVDAFRDALPGMNKRKHEAHNPTPEEREIQEAKDYIAEKAPSKEKDPVAERIGSFILRNLKRGVTAVAIGSTAFAATSSVDGDTKSETHKLNLKASVAGGVVTGGVVAGVGQALLEMPKHGMANQAKYIYDAVTDMRFWYTAAFLAVGSEFATNVVKKWWLGRKAKALAEAESEQA